LGCGGDGIRIREQGICSGTETRNIFAENHDNPCEAEIDGSRKESRRNSETDNVDEEIVACGVERVDVQYSRILRRAR
jgi:hypothetical protein